MKNDLVKKGLVLGIILLFVGLSVIPSNANIVNKNSASMESEVISNEYLGNINFNISRFSTEVGFEHPEDTNYTFSVVNGNYTLNFTIGMDITSGEKLLLSRGAFTFAKISTDDSLIWKAVGINFVRGDFVGPWDIEDIERDFNDPPINGRENVTMSIILKGRGFPFGFLKPEETSFTITVHFVEE